MNDIYEKYLRNETVSEREAVWCDMLQNRGIDDPCPKCSGYGVKVYSSTATWMGGIGGQMITNGVCDECWGSGDANRKWTDLRVMMNRVRDAEINNRRLHDENNNLKKMLDNKGIIS